MSPIASPDQRTNYRVHLAVFEGPLDLLLHLIESEELDITRVSLALVTDQYLAYLSALEEWYIGDLTDFVVVASRLLLIKSRALLPRPPHAAADDEPDPADELLRQLRAYKRFKEAAEQLAARHLEGHRSYVRLAQPPRLETRIEHLDAVPLEALVAAAERAMKTRPLSTGTGDVVEPFTISINERIDLIRQTLVTRLKISFTSVLSTAYTRQEVVVTLLAVLELIKRREIRVSQERLFGEITLSLI